MVMKLNVAVPLFPFTALLCFRHLSESRFLWLYRQEVNLQTFEMILCKTAILS